MKIEVSGTQDLHSGVDGGVFPEPMADLVRLLGYLIGPDEKCLVPGFYAKVRQVSKEDDKLYDEASKVMAKLELAQGDGSGGNYTRKAPKQAVLARWHHPTISFHGVQVSGIGTATVIPG